MKEEAAMTAVIIPFKRNLHTELAKLIAISGEPTVQDLLDRHERIRLLWEEGRTRCRAGLAEWDYLNEISTAYYCFDNYCMHNGIAHQTIDAFNKERVDLKHAHSRPDIF